MFEKYLVVYVNNHHVLPTDKKRKERDRQTVTESERDRELWRARPKETIREMKRGKGAEELKAKNINKILYFRK